MGKISKSSSDLDLDPTIPNVKLLRGSYRAYTHTHSHAHGDEYSISVV